MGLPVSLAAASQAFLASSTAARACSGISPNPEQESRIGNVRDVAPVLFAKKYIDVISCHGKDGENFLL